jgi:hypothetical protein
VPWNEFTGTQRAAWEAAAQAAVKAARSAASALDEELAQARRERDRYAELLIAGDAERAALKRAVTTATAALRDVKDTYPPGHHGHDAAHAALDQIGAGQ